jgi:hypothetical protein
MSGLEVGCQCCNRLGAGVVLGGASGTLALSMLSCGGDDSALCCNVQAYGQVVVAIGRLTPVSSTHPSSPPDPKWTLDGVRLCIEHD